MALPEGWRKAIVEDVAEIIMGQSPKGANTNTAGDGIPLVGGASDLGDEYPEPSKYTTQPTKLSQNDDLILCIRATIGRINRSGGQYCLGRGVAGVRSLGADTDWLKYFWEAHEQPLQKLGTGTTFKQVDKKKLNGFPVNVPPLNEQRRIADKIDALQAKSRRAREALETVGPLLEKFRQSVLAAAFRGDLTAEWRKQHPDVEPAEKLLERIRVERRARWEEAELAKMRAKGIKPKNDKWKAKYTEPESVDESGLPKLPEGWCWTNLEEIIIDGPQNGLYVPKSRYGKGTRILRIDDYQAGWTREVDELQRVMIDEVDVERYGLNMHYIVVNRVNSMTHLGKTTVIKENMLPLVFESNMMAFLTTTTITPEYIEHYLNSDSGRYELVKNAKHAVNQASINQKDVQATLIPLPPEDESRIIASSVDNAFKLITQLSQIIQQSESDISRLDQSILAKAFRGELVPQDPNDEPASVLLERIKAERNAAKGNKKTRRKA